MSQAYDLLNYVHWRGNPGGKVIYGGTAVDDSLTLVSTSSASGSGDYISLQLDGGAHEALGIVVGTDITVISLNNHGASKRLDLQFQDNAAAKWTIRKETDNTFSIYDEVGARAHMSFATGTTPITQLYSNNAGAQGPFLRFYHESASPADNDLTGIAEFYAEDDGSTARQLGYMGMIFLDVTATTMDSQLNFAVMDNVNAGNANKLASLSSLGVWTDASGEEGKEFEGVIPEVLLKLKALRVEKYRSNRVPPEKLAAAERHYSPTAEDFYAVFGLGKDPSIHNPGIAPKDLAGIAIAAIQEIIPRLEALEAK